MIAWFTTLMVLSGLPDFAAMTTQSTAGEELRIPDATAKATVLLFTVPGCPVCNAYGPEMERLPKDYGDAVVFLRIYPDPYMKRADVDAHTEEYDFTTPAILDDDLAIAAKSGAHMTPEAIVITRDGAIVYRGRIDDRYADYGRQRKEPATRELRDALDAVLAGKPVKVAVTKTLGCEIPFPIEPQPSGEEE